MAPYVPKYVRPEEIAENRARMWRWLIGIAIAIPVAFIFFAFGYSDQAPAFIRNSLVTVDRALGYPIIGLLSLILG